MAEARQQYEQTDWVRLVRQWPSCVHDGGELGLIKSNARLRNALRYRPLSDSPLVPFA